MTRPRERVLGLLDGDDETRLRVMPGAAGAGRAATAELTVVVPARDEARNLPGCLASLVEQSEEGFALGVAWQIVVVDDASSDGTWEIAEGVRRSIEAAAADANDRVRPPEEKPIPFGNDNKRRKGETSAGTAAGAGVAESLVAGGDDLLPGDGGDGRASAMVVLRAPVLEAKGRLTGKNNACWAGAEVAAGAWLLFTDADTVFTAGAVSRSLREAERHGVDLLSYSPRQITTGAAQRVVMPLIFSELATVYPPAEVNDPGKSLAAANGQFLLVRAERYFEVGGHRALGGDVLEDVALARAVKRRGGRLRLRYAPEAVATRMYRTAAEMVQGWTKNLAALMPSPVALALWRALDFVLLLALPLLAVLVPHLVLWQRTALELIALRTGLRYYTRVARAHAGFWATALSPLGLPLFCYLLLRSAWAYRVGRRVVWKGRSYDPNRV